jgi:nucleoside-diphosphate-sugar epimerase
MRLDRLVRLAYVDDAVETLMRTMQTAEHPPAVVAPASEASVVDVAHMIAECAGLVGVEVRDGSNDAPPSMPVSARPTLVDALPASIALGLVPSVDLAEGLGRTLRWFEARTNHRRPEDRPSGVYERDTVVDAVPAPETRRTG